ncbi:Rpn family recombination-promoting nuclease/putative transposase [Bacillus thuringiensis]|uniref:Rpn family recombination-promoting nuclease/putative transposase n=1 Tax=Bacillus thuringiensis TaxID=1428 RepID=UPI0021B36C38|nr:Rpn family recombination-promoting nuclease/putative transposase [Bacillus thuringiensis]
MFSLKCGRYASFIINSYQLQSTELLDLLFIGISKTMNKWENMSHDSSFRTAYEAREKLLLDEQAKLAHAREEGLEEGIEKGIEKGKIQLIRGMHKNGMPLEDIAKFTGLSTEEIRKLLL